jgi:phage baseplate assembly protein W
MSATAGVAIEGDAHLAQSIGDILSTPIGTRPMRRDYGSALFELLDAPLNGVTRLRLFAAAALAIARWEPRISLTRVTLDAPSAAAGAATLKLEGNRTDDPGPNALVALSIPLRPFNA